MNIGNTAAVDVLDVPDMIAEVRRSNMSCKCMARTLQQECPGIPENVGMDGK